MRNAECGMWNGKQDVEFPLATDSLGFTRMKLNSREEILRVLCYSSTQNRIN